ncbi:DNA recombination protein RmuC [Naasia sp. SYSU D00057]|uniref:DNA recombination protein RmuC n=1 Tax=Naasia sp. SYSU D00057 TaxID=2817380 RepID=UPI001B301098|nr:DNA recombination protein RmuC [Naasia sp. SYSU D00057]
MDLALFLLLGLLVGVALGIPAGVALVKRRGSAGAVAVDPAVVEARHQAALLQVRAEEATAKMTLERELASIQATAEGLRSQVAAHELRFRDLMERQASEQAAQKQRDAVESRVLQALTPVQETLRTMQGKVAELESQRSQQYGAIAEQLSQTRQSNEQIRATAESLASALRNNSTRGVWGETQLRNVVEAAGLTNRVDFSLQTTIAGEAGAGRPDMVVRLPGGKSIAVDSKVPYSKYLDASAIPVTATGDEDGRRRALLAEHAKQVKAHIDALAGKAYWTGLDASPEFTIAFIPSESLLAAALEQDPGLLEYAFNKRVPLASPVSLWAVLKTVAFTWQQDVLTEDAKRLFDLGKTLYQRLATLSEHAEGLRKSIERTVDSYNRFAGSLEGRVLVTARALDKLDPSKVIPTPQHIESTPKKLTAGELTEALPDEDDTVAEDSGPAVAERDAAILAVIEHELEAIAPHEPELMDPVPAPEAGRNPEEQSA